MTLQQLIYFREVARERHFTRAADNLFVAQSSLSHAIRLLEEELGVPLLLRQSGKSVELTPYGEALLPSVDRIMAEIDRAKNAIDQLRDPSGGIVNVVYSYINGYNLIPRMLKAFREDPRSTGIEVHVEINHGPRYFEKEMDTGKVDVTFSAGAHFEGLSSVPVAEQKLFACVPADHPLAQQDSVTLEELADQHLLMYTQGRHLHHWVQRMFEYSGLTLSPGEFFEDWSELIGAVALGEGIVICPRLPMDDELVRVVKLEHPMSIRYIYMHCQDGVKLPKAVETFRDFCIEYFQKQNGGNPIIPEFEG